MSRGHRMASVRCCSLVTSVTVAIFGGCARLPCSASYDNAALKTKGKHIEEISVKPCMAAVCLVFLSHIFLWCVNRLQQNYWFCGAYSSYQRLKAELTLNWSLVHSRIHSPKVFGVSQCSVTRQPGGHRGSTSKRLRNVTVSLG